MKKLLILLFILSFTSTTFAQKVSEQQALHKAQNFFKEKGIISKNPRRSVKKSVQQQTESAQEDFYVFNAENKGGFVIISGDERTPEVLGYADSGSLDMDTLPPNLKGWLEGYSKQIKAIDSLGITKRSVSKRAPKAAIATLMTTEWGQGDPYNMNCPVFFDQGYNCVTGCVATAMAQVMYYHRANSTNNTTATISGYNSSSIWLFHEEELITVETIPEGAIIDWDNMLDSYNGSETDIQKEAVANLMLYCGASIKMDYGASSAAFSEDVPIALKKYFDYSENTTLVYRHNYTEEGWDELIYFELSKGNPIYYSGYNSEAGHAFVCDGYDGNGYYHINWGWDGLCNTFFLLDALNPTQQGTGGSSAGYNNGQCALIGAVPNGEIMRLTSQNVSLTGNTSFILSETGDNITVPVRWEVQNMTGTSYSFDHAIGLYYKDELVKVLKETGTSEMFTANQEKTIDTSLVIETNLSTGIYQLYALSRSQGEEKWFRNENSSDSYITLVIKDGFMSFYVGKPAVAENVINFADDEVKRICVENWDTDGDGEISYEEAAAVTDFGGVFDLSIIKTFDEAQYFTGITSFGIVDGYGGCPSLVSIKIPTTATSIKRGGFFSCNALTSIDIPTSIKEIGEYAFEYCFALHEVSLHEGLDRINEGAFYACGFNSITIPTSVSFIGKYAWGDCPNLIDINVDDNNQNYCSINGVLFTKDKKNLVVFPCKREGSYNIPIGTETITPRAFYSSALKEIVFPESLKSLGEQAFQYMENLKEFTIPSTIATIGEGVFWGCSDLKSVTIEGSRSKIPKDMFIYCFRLNSIILPEDITSIGEHAFMRCEKLTEITIPSKVTCIGDSAFAYTGLRRITSLMETPCAISSSVFENPNLDPILYVPEQSVAAYKEADNWKKFTQILPIGEIGIEPYAKLNNGVLSFYYDTKREERNGITYDIPFGGYPEWHEKNNTVIKVIFDASFADARPTITQGWFDGCENLTEVQGIENLNTSGVVDMFGMFQHCHSLTSIDISHFNTSKVTSMDGMFFGCSNLKTIILPDDITFIDSYQFAYCSSLTDISIPSSVTFIRERAFHRCYSLKEITIPADVTSIGDNAFSYSGLTKVTSLMQTPCGISSTVFENVSNIVILYVPEESLDAYKEADNWKNFSILPIGEAGIEPYVEFYNGVLSFYCDVNRDERDGKTYEITDTDYRLENRNDITKVIFDISFAVLRPRSTSDWFAGCENLAEIQGIENLNISEVTDMAGMFQGCHSLTTIDLSNVKTSKVTRMAAMFLGCNKLKTVILPDDLTFIDSYQFAYCYSLSEISIPASVTSIGQCAFQNCTSLVEVTIPADVTSIGDNAFSSSGLTKVTSLMQTPCEINSGVFEGIGYCAALFVPEESIDAYKIADHWKNFSQIIPIGEKAKEPYAEYYNGGLTFYYDINRDERDGTTYDIRYEFLRSIALHDIKNAITKVTFDTSFAHVKPNSTRKWFEGFENLITIQGIENLNTSEVINMWDMFSGCRSLTSIDLSYFDTSKVITMIEMFRGCGNLKTIILPDDLTFIDDYQFDDCSSLTDISIPSSVTTIGERAFHYCTSLKEITISSNVTSIGDNAFSSSGLTKVTSLMQTPCVISSTVFENVSNNATLYVPAGCKAAYEAADYWKDFKKIMGPSSNLIYMVDGEEYRSYEIEHGDAITPEPAPTKEGYIFSGWSEIPETMPAHDVTVTGTFSINKYKLTYIVDGEVYKSYDIEYGSTITPEEEPTKDDYTFSGWSEIPETMPAHDVTVTGTFSINKYKLTYVVDGVEYKSYDIEYGSTIIPEEEPTKEGYTFSGWSEIPETMPAHDVIVTGTFSINKYKLTYTVDGVEYKTYDIEYGTSITPIAEPIKEGYSFSGWSEIPATMPAHDVTVTGTFSINKYKLTYIVDGIEYKSYDIEYGATITPEAEPTKEGYTFSGWSEIPATMPAHDVTVTGRFTLDTGIEEIMSNANGDVMIFIIDGKRVDNLKKGMNVIRMKDGTTRKVVVK